MNYKEYFAGKKITVMGLGLLGRQVGDAEWLAQQGAELIVTDLKSAEVLKTSVDRLSVYSNVTFRLGGHEKEDFVGRDFILKAAGVPDIEVNKNIYTETARQDGAKIKMSASWLIELAGDKFEKTVGVTGTKGKSTVSSMIIQFLEKHISPEKYIFGGNVRGVSNLMFLDDLQDGTIGVFELDSWQLQGFADANISPEIGVFTNFSEDHLNYYKGDMSLYFRDKAAIYKSQSAGDLVVIGPGMEDAMFDYGITTVSKIVEVSADSPKADFVRQHNALPGEHNIINALMAGEVLFELGYSNPGDYKVWLEGLKPVEGRLQLLCECNGVKIYNDNNATAPVATVAGIQSIAGGRNVVLIMGGDDKDMPLDDIFVAIQECVHTIALLPGSGSDKVRDRLNEIKGVKLFDVSSVQEAVTVAVQEAQENDVVLFSPTFTSFSLFNNEYERNDEFMRVVSELN